MTNEERDRFIMDRLNEGVSLSDVQKLLSEAGVRMTYFELRMLAGELQVDWHRQDRPAPAPGKTPEPDPRRDAPDGGSAAGAPGEEDDPFPEDDADYGGAPPEDDFPEDDEDEDGAGGDGGAPGAAAGGAASRKVRIEVSKLIRPGAAVSGSVVFPSGSKGEWYVDNLGRLGLSLAEGSAKPTREDVAAFQRQLPRALGYGG